MASYPPRAVNIELITADELAAIKARKPRGRHSVIPDRVRLHGLTDAQKQAVLALVHGLRTANRLDGTVTK
jgi:hypothetical protein